jgi:hypothetical protein
MFENPSNAAPKPITEAANSSVAAIAAMEAGLTGRCMAPC